MLSLIEVLGWLKVFQVTCGNEQSGLFEESFPFQVQQFPSELTLEFLGKDKTKIFRTMVLKGNVSLSTVGHSFYPNSNLYHFSLCCEVISSFLSPMLFAVLSFTLYPCHKTVLSSIKIFFRILFQIFLTLYAPWQLKPCMIYLPILSICHKEASLNNYIMQD